ncbi:MAG: deoxyribose-phosphate aldolase [Clostridia bacterium]|nr:deoxyribose-phosphate aldolase [Clostridia bacterium]
MDIKKILSSCDHTLLAQTATEEQIKQLCLDAEKYNTASVCIPPSYVSFAKKNVGDSVKICTVIGFPNGYNTTEVKCFEAENAVKNGADEIDMVINIGWVKDKKFENILYEINQVKKACNGRLLKVIIETCLLTDEEKKEMCRIVSRSDADYIKTSTGFSTGGATVEDIKLFSENVGNNTLIKAAGGISSLEDADGFLKLGASRLGTSRIVKLVKAGEENE